MPPLPHGRPGVRATLALLPGGVRGPGTRPSTWLGVSMGDDGGQGGRGSAGRGPRCPEPPGYHGKQTPRKPTRLPLVKPDAEMEMET